MSGSEVATQGDGQEKKPNVLAQAVAAITENNVFINFRGRAMVMAAHPYVHFEPLHFEDFERVAYRVLDHPTQSRVRDAHKNIIHTAPDYTNRDHLILFGSETPTDEQLLAPGLPGKPQVWNMRDLAIDRSEEAATCVWRSPYPLPLVPADPPRRHPFIMQLAVGDTGLYDDIMQSIAPLIMEKKPDGVCWWVGDGANGKSTLMDAIYRIFPGQLTSLTVKALEAETDTPNLNGTLGNVVKESSEGRVDDTNIYKSIGTHEDFRVHKFYSQETSLVRGNVHHIFSANQVPAFNDKGHSARRRTFIIPFPAVFESDPDFERKTFTPDFFGELIAEMMRYAKIIERQGYKYKWSAVTLAAKASYDQDANNAEAYAREMISKGLVAFNSFKQLHFNYEQWCEDVATPALGRPAVKKAFLALGFEEARHRPPGAASPQRIYRLKGDHGGDLVQFGPYLDGFWTVPGFQVEDDEIEAVQPIDFSEPEAPEPAEDPEPVERPSILKGNW